MRYLLDTHVLVWWLAGGGNLSRKQRDLLSRLEKKGELLGFPAIGLWELARLIETDRIEVHVSPDVLFDDLDAHPRIEIIPISARIALESTRLGPGFPRDPADQLIAATARVHGLTLVTADRRVRESGVVSVM